MYLIPVLLLASVSPWKDLYAVAIGASSLQSGPQDEAAGLMLKGISSGC